MAREDRDDGVTFHAYAEADLGGFYDGDWFYGQSYMFRTGPRTLINAPRIGVCDGNNCTCAPKANRSLSVCQYDEADASQLFHSTDLGLSWRCLSQAAGGWCKPGRNCSFVGTGMGCSPCANIRAKFGVTGDMYHHFLRLQDGRLLVTFTHRSNMLDDDGAALGLRAALSSDADGTVWDLETDRIAFQSNAGDPALVGWPRWYAPQSCGCGYGNTIQLDDGALITVYS